MKLVSLFALALACAATASAETYTVNSIADLQTRLGTMVAGDTIIVANGNYTANSTLTINKVGTAAAPILIRAETVGGVTISGSRGFSFSSPAAYVTVQGFVLTHASAISIPSGTKFCRLSRNIIELAIPSGSDVSYVNISGDDVEIDRNELRNKSTLGEMLDIAGSGSQVARRLWVHHNYFHDFTSPGGNGAETIRWGLSGLSLSNGFGICEYNLFVRCDGENEMISNKSSSNIYRYNTVIDSREISQRHGDNCQYYGNYMINSEGIRVCGDSHQIFSNYLEGNSKGVDMGNGDGDVHAGDPLTAHDRPDNCVVTFNTLINNTSQYQMGGRTGGLGATNTTFANNIIVGGGGGSAVSISSSAPYTNPVWEGNILWNTTGAGALPAGSYINADPLLVRDANGVYRLQAGSPAIDSAAGAYAAVTLDQDGQARTGAKDKGADEFSSAPVAPLARLLTPADVGPHSSDTPIVVTAPTITREPTSVTVSPNSTAVFTVVASGNSPAYQWNLNGTAINGATAATFVLPNATAANAGDYTVTITNASGSVTSAAATLAFSSTTDFGRLINLSILTDLTASDPFFTVGFVIGGAGTSGTKPLLLRAAGPSLIPLGVGGAHTDPVLDVLSGETVIATNDNWDGAQALLTAFSQVGAFAYTSADSKDAATFNSATNAGNYTVRVRGNAGATGTVIAELYDATGAAFTASTPRLINVSVLKHIPANATLTAGFVLGGTTARTVLVRAIGPGLSAFGVGSPLTDPQLALFSGQTQIAANDNWGGDPQLTAAAAAVGAFQIQDLSSKDAFLLVTLPPGPYTAQVSGVAGSSGTALVEVYEVR